MKSIIFASFLLCFTVAAHAQQGWVPLTSGTTATLNYISLVGQDTLYVSGNTALRSTDGGITWDSLTNIPSYKGARMTSALVQFVDDTTGFLCASADTVYKTTNGGQTWNKGGATGLAGGLIPVTMVFKTRNFGCISDGGHTSRTTDGGATWQETEVTIRSNCMAFAGTLHGFGMGNLQPWYSDPTKPYAAAFEYTSDGAATWNLTYAGPSEDGRHSGVTSEVWGIAAINADTLFAVGQQIAKSLDGGITWDTILYPGDNGFETYESISFSDNHNGWTVSYGGKILRTTDGGSTWVMQNSGVTLPLLAVYAVDSLIGYASGIGGTILKTTNAGKSWVQLSTGISSLLQNRVYPQPAGERTFLAYTLPSMQHVTLSVNNVTGAKVSDVLNGVLQPAGTQTVTIDTSQFPSGTYTYVLQTGKYYATGKIEVIH